MPKSKKEFITLLSKKMNTTEEISRLWVEAYTDTLIEVFKTGQGVTIDGLGGFYLQNKYSGTAFKFNPSQKIRKILGWSSSYTGDL